MNGDVTDYVRHRKERSLETLDEARLLFENGKLHGCVRSLYYACFYAVEALLRTEGKHASKHSGVQSLFNRFWVKPGRIPVDLGRFYSELFDARHAGDYDYRRKFAAPEVEQWLEQAQQFVETVVRHVNHWLAGREQREGPAPR